jgi:hypothetical protein
VPPFMRGSGAVTLLIEVRNPFVQSGSTGGAFHPTLHCRPQGTLTMENLFWKVRNSGAARWKTKDWAVGRTDKQAITQRFEFLRGVYFPDLCSDDKSALPNAGV